MSQVTIAALSTALQAGNCLCWGSSAKKIKLMFTSVLTKLFITFAKNLHPRFRGNDLCACLKGNTERATVTRDEVSGREIDRPSAWMAVPNKYKL